MKCATASVSLEFADDSIERALAQFLNNRYGDGSIILRSNEDRELARIGRQQGLISDYGFITPAGQVLAAEYA